MNAGVVYSVSFQYAVPVIVAANSDGLPPRQNDFWAKISGRNSSHFQLGMVIAVDPL